MDVASTLLPHHPATLLPHCAGAGDLPPTGPWHVHTDVGRQPAPCHRWQQKDQTDPDGSGESLEEEQDPFLLV